ncbi:MAG: RES domain-containing protein [Pyrinomonadaceae bacterium]|nr:RES domain-containing protein [Pyrinomonadaceae bacterium]
MMPTGWRIVKTKYAAHAFDGEGARLYGGRWNSPGLRMVYTSESLALAALEILAHMGKSSMLAFYSRCAAHFDDSLVTSLDRSRLPANWRTYPSPSELQFLGGAWMAAETSVVLEVPSVMIETESNYLLNPLHPDYASLVIDPPEPFDFDPRLIS